MFPAVRNWIASQSPPGMEGSHYTTHSAVHSPLVSKLELPSDDYAIRPATSRDISFLSSIEISAAALFGSVPALAHMAEDKATVPLAALAAACKAGTLWVATYKELPDDYAYDTPIAFLCACVLDNGLFVREMSVAQQHQTKGLGRLLVRTAEDYAGAKGLPHVALATDKHVSWNGPFFGRLGYREVPAELVGPEHLAVVEREEVMGMDMERRCVMIKKLRVDTVYDDD